MNKCFIIPLRTSILMEENDYGEAGLALHVPLQLLHLCLDHQVNRFMGCDCHIEVFFRVLQQGRQIEHLRVQTKPRLVNAIAIYLIIAWRIHTITMLSRAYPAVSCEVVFEAHEWQTIYTMQHHRRPPQAPPPLREIVRCLAQLGGFLARRGDGEPGIQCIWQGYRRLQESLPWKHTARSLLPRCV
jgi:hypothetical protein